MGDWEKFLVAYPHLYSVFARRFLWSLPMEVVEDWLGSWGAGSEHELQHLSNRCTRDSLSGKPQGLFLDAFRSVCLELF